MHLRIDNREPKEIGIQLSHNHGIEVTYEQLPIGDYLFSDVCVERKTISDLLQSSRGRLWNQLKNMKDNYDRPVLLVEGYIPNGIMNNDALKIEFNVLSIIASIALGWGIPIIPTHNQRQTALELSIMFTRSSAKKKQYLRPVKKQGLSMDDRREDILCMAPGIGRKTARRIFNNVTSISDICSLSEKELENVVGSKRARKLYELLHDEYTPKGEK